jgi:riboflavin kinase/FMN adenylyltransferase
MQIFHLSSPFEHSLKGMPNKQVLALGDFDGIHLGHQEVIQRALKTAKLLGLPVSIMTFNPHPRAILGQSKYEQVLTPLKEKMEWFAKLGIQYTYLVDFNAAFAQITPEFFVDGILQPMGIESIIVGFDFTFGHQGRGTADTLSFMSRGRFAVEVVRPFHLDGDKVSSTRIREYLQDRHVDKANELLGRIYRIQGIVVTGEGRGRTIGFPTANIEPTERYVLPAQGVYAVRVGVKGKHYNGAMNIGVKPTFSTSGEVVTLEVHLFDFHEMIYGEEVQIEFVHFIRAEKKFSSVDDLILQIHTDVRLAKQKLGAFS